MLQVVHENETSKSAGLKMRESKCQKTPTNPIKKHLGN